MQENQKSRQWWFYAGWIALTIVYLLLRFQNIGGVFLSTGVVIDDTDPYYRLHRILTMLQTHSFYPLYDPNLSYPIGVNVAWPLGLDLLIALPLYFYHFISQVQVETFAAVVIPFLSLPLLWCSGAVGTLLIDRMFGFLLGVLVTFGQTLIIQSELGRIDHHFMEAMFPIAILMFLLKYKEWHKTYDLIWITAILSLAPSFCPQGWILAPLIFTSIIVSKDWDLLSVFARVFLFSGLLSILPLACSDRFQSGYFNWISFSWWTPWLYLGVALLSELIALIVRKSSSRNVYKMAAIVSFICVTAFIFSKNPSDFLYRNIQSQIYTLAANQGMMSITVEARTPFQLSQNSWMHGDFYLLIMGSVCFFYFLFQKKYLFILGFSAISIALSYCQIRFYTFSFFFCALILSLFFYDFISRLDLESKWKKIFFCVLIAMMIVPFRPSFGLIDYKNHHEYYSAVRSFTTFLNNEFKRLDRPKEKQSILAHWDYGHWLLYYTGLPVVSDPFQGLASSEVINLFTSKGTDELGPFIEKHPATYLLLESGAARSYQWIEVSGKNGDEYFEKIAESPHHELFKTKDAFNDLFMYRYFFELGRGLNNESPKDWRLVYISPEKNPTDPSLPAIKVFEHVQGAQIHVSTRNNSEELYLQADIMEEGDATVFQQTAKGVHDFTWTVPYGNYSAGNVAFDGVYVIRDPKGNILYRTPPISEAEVLRGDKIDVFF